MDVRVAHLAQARDLHLLEMAHDPVTDHFRSGIPGDTPFPDAVVEVPTIQETARRAEERQFKLGFLEVPFVTFLRRSVGGRPKKPW